MKFLILTVTVGHGHNQTAKSIAEYIKSQGHNALVLDTLEYINPLFKESFNRSYLISTSMAPKTYGKFYRLAEKKERNDSMLSPNKITTALLSKKVIDFIKDYAPDAIICTHVTAAQFISAINDSMPKVPTVGVITDFTIHPFWDETNIDYYVLPNEFLKYQAVKKGISEEKLLFTGIPISLKFSSKNEKAIARSAAGIEDKTTVLIMSGSMGYGNVFKIIKSICDIPLDFQIITVCGNNKSLKKKIDRADLNKKVYNYGFTDQIDNLMDASDILVTKPGGLTVSEAMAKEIPMILINPIPGQEERNREFMVNNGAAMSHSSTLTADDLLYQALTNKDRLLRMRESIKSLRKPYAAKELVDFIIKKVNENNA